MLEYIYLYFRKDINIFLFVRFLPLDGFFCKGIGNNIFLIIDWISGQIYNNLKIKIWNCPEIKIIINKYPNIYI